MTINKREFSNTMLNTVMNSLNDFFSSQDNFFEFKNSKKRGGEFDKTVLDYDVLSGIPIYIVPSGDFDKKVMTGWQFPIWDNQKEKVISFADFDADKENVELDENALRSFSDNETVIHNYNEALKLVEEYNIQESKTKYELRVLQVPNAYSHALWLVSEKHSFFIPFVDIDILSGSKLVEVNKDYENEIKAVLSTIIPDPGEIPQE